MYLYEQIDALDKQQRQEEKVLVKALDEELVQLRTQCIMAKDYAAVHAAHKVAIVALAHDYESKRRLHANVGIARGAVIMDETLIIGGKK